MVRHSTYATLHCCNWINPWWIDSVHEPCGVIRVQLPARPLLCRYRSWISSFARFCRGADSFQGWTLFHEAFLEDTYYVYSLTHKKTVWPSGLRRHVKAVVRKGVGSNPTAVTFFTSPFLFSWREKIILLKRKPGKSFQKHLAWKPLTCAYWGQKRKFVLELRGRKKVSDCQ